ncbi:MAG TPA: ACT domain-containing protein [Clostridiales bacterium]|nr:ACT domain-containing protein [Clostridiales bacterium]
MLVQQISVFVENKKGRLVGVTEVLAKNNIDICAISIADTTNFGILRMIVDAPALAVEELKKDGYTVSTTEVIAVEIKDQPGGLNEVLKILRDHDISIEYLYSFVKRPAENALILFRVENTKKALDVLRESDVKIVSEADIYNIK